MLTQVPTAIRVGVRAMTMRHPNAMPCMVYRRVVTRAAGAGVELVGGLPTLGGLTVMDNEDEVETDYPLLGEARILFAGAYQPMQMGDRRDFNEAALGEATIEPMVEGAFECKDGDLVMVMPGGGVVIPYEVTKVIGVVNIPPYVPKYEVAPQGDLLSIEAVAESLAAR